MQIIIGALMTGVGAIMVIKSESLLNAFGRISFFETYLGTEGGSRLGYKLIGIFVSFIGILLISGLFQGFLMWVLSPLIEVTRRGNV